MPRIAISSGHGLHVRGASGLIDEVNEARRVVDEVCRLLTDDAVAFHDNTSTSQQENLETIVAWHNNQDRDFDVSVHFNCGEEPTDGERGVEVFYYTAVELAGKMSAAIAKAGELINRGAKEGQDLYFLKNTERPGILIEVCFVDAAIDVELYQDNFHAITLAIARVLWNGIEPLAYPVTYPVTAVSGMVSWFGGPYDTGVAPDEGLAFFYDDADADAAPHIFLPKQPAGTTGLARRLDPRAFYVAIRWDYDTYPKEMLASGDYQAMVRVPATGRQNLAYPADWGPHSDTGRVADVSPGLMVSLNIQTDDVVEVIFPAQK